MHIQVEKLWLFETEISDPFFLGTKDGVTATMQSPRIIEFLDIVTVYFFIDTVAKSGLSYSLKYGGEDDEISQTYGKSKADYQISFNLPVLEQRKIEEIMGKQFSILGMRRDLSRFVLFGQFMAEDLKIDNEVQQRVTFKATNTNAKIYTVQSVNITNILDTITEGDVDDLITGGFDYGLDFEMN